MAEIKRLHYYDHQYLREPDFTAEQSYHKEMRYRHNRSLHTYGVVHGLKMAGNSVNEIVVSPGMALDSAGRELVLEAPVKVAVNLATGDSRFVIVKFNETQTDEPEEQYRISPTDRTRWTERPVIELSEAAPTNVGLVVVLGKVTRAQSSLTIEDGEYPNNRRYSGASGEGHFSKVGIGTDSPSQKLTVEGGIKLSNRIYASGVGAGDNLWLMVNNEDEGSAGHVMGLYSDGSDNNTNHITINGKLDIQSNLDVRGNIINGGPDFILGQFDGRLQGAKTLNRALVHTDWGIGGDNLVINFAGDFEGGVHIQGPKTVLDGSVGIGTPSPGGKLEVAGDIKVSGRILSPEGTLRDAGGGWVRTYGATGWYNNTHGGGWYMNDSTWIRSYGNKNIYHNTGILRTDGTLQVGNNGDRFIVKTDGKVGIGTNDPNEMLEVDGNVKIRGTNGSGNLSISGPNLEGEGWGGCLRIRSSSGSVFLAGGEIDTGDDDSYLYLNRHSMAKVVVGRKESTADGDGMEIYGYLEVIRRNKFNPAITVDGDLHVTGSISADGSKQGYVTDCFVNQSGDVLEQGDVVVFGKKPVKVYHGKDDNIPVPEVDLTTTACDYRVCGIVADIFAREEPRSPRKDANKDKQRKGKAHIDAKLPSILEDGVKWLQAFTAEELEKIDKKKISKGQIGNMVTLGCFAHCKVDADIAPIRVGDLLTTSPTRGHAQKVMDSGKAIGAIIGKALSPLKKGKGKIPVMVLLQ